MITVKLDGGIGNQMFQYAAAKSLALKLDSPLSLDIEEFEDSDIRTYDLHVFPNINEGFCGKAQHEKLYGKSLFARIERKIRRIQLYKEPYFHFDPNFFSLAAPVALSGYFQSELYFSSHASDIRKKFQWAEDKLSSQTIGYLKSIRATTAVSVHFRRGDYISSKATNEFHGTCSQSYYRSSINFLADRFHNIHYFVFSDDIGWVKAERLFDGLNHTYMEKTADMHDSEEMFLMTKCDHNIVANSSFSWWGAWLNSAPDKVVIAPTQWFKTAELDTRDLVPDRWMRL